MGELVQTADVQARSILPQNGPWFLTAKFWKRFSVVLSVFFSIVSLVLSAIVSLKPESGETLRALTISSIVVNSLSVSLSALTSLDWQQDSTHDKAFAERLMKISHVHEGSTQNLVVTGKIGGMVKTGEDY